MFQKGLFVAAASALLITSAAQASRVRSTGERCDRSITMNSLTDSERVAINRGQQVYREVKQSNGFVMGYILAYAPYDAELAMGVYSQCDKHAGNNGLGDFIKQSRYVTDGRANPFRVFYEQQVNWPYDNGTYTVENTISEDNGSYILNTKLVDSSDASFSPQYADGYVRMTPSGQGTFVVACNYMVPRTGSFQGTFNDLARDRLKESGRRLLAWVSRVSQDNDASNEARERLKTLLHK